MHLTRREPKQAETVFLKAVELEPDLIDAYVRLGNLYGTTGQYDEALAKLGLTRTVATLVPGFATALAQYPREFSTTYCAVVGAGIAGATVAHALALRGWPRLARRISSKMQRSLRR